MPDLSNVIKEKCKEILGRSDIVKVKQTDDPDVGLALFAGGFGIWVDLKAEKATKPGTIGGKKVTLKRPPKLS